MQTKPVWAWPVVLGVLLTACSTPPGQGRDQRDSVLDAVKSRGQLVCGINDVAPDFGFRQPDGTYAGFDIDYCKGRCCIGDGGA